MKKDGKRKTSVGRLLSRELSSAELKAVAGGVETWIAYFDDDGEFSHWADA